MCGAGADRVGVHLAPRADAHTMGDSNLAATFGFVAKELGKRKIAFIAAREHEAADSFEPQLKKAFGGVFIANEGKRGGHHRTWRCRRSGVGQDVHRQFESGAPLNDWDASTFYAPGAMGYTDYPLLETGE